MASLLYSLHISLCYSVQLHTLLMCITDTTNCQHVSMSLVQPQQQQQEERVSNASFHSSLGGGLDKQVFA